MQNNFINLKCSTAILFLVSAVLCTVIIGCSPSSILIIPDFEDSELAKNDLKRKNIEIVDVIDKRSMEGNYIGTVPIGFFNTMVPTYLFTPISEFVRNVLEKLIVLPRDSAQTTPLTVFIDSFQLAGKDKLWSFFCQLRFAYPVTPDSYTQVPIRVNKTALNWFDNENVLKDLMYEGVIECTKTFVDSVVDKSTNMYAIQSNLSGDKKIIEKMAELEKPPPVIDESKNIPTQFGLQLSYLRFTSPLMKKAYGGAVCGYFDILAYSGTYFGHEFKLGVSFSAGSADIIDNSWTVSNHKLGLNAYSFDYSLLWHFTAADPFKEFAPYIGTGGGIVIGVENINAKASRTINDEIEEISEDSDALRGIFECHVQCGSIFSVSEKTRIKLEAKFTFSGKSAYGDWKDEDKERLNAGLYTVMSRPDFQFTGFNIGITFFIK